MAPMRGALTSCLFSAALWASGPAAVADVVTLENGDRITGSVVKKEEDILKFKTSYAGTLEIKWEEVAHLHTDEPVEVMLEDESVVEATEIPGGRAGPAPAGSAKEPFPGLNGDFIKTVKPDPWEKGKGGKFSGKVNFSMKLEDGSVEKDEIDADYEVAYRRGKHRYSSRGQLEFDTNEGTTSKQDWLTLFNYNYFLNEKAYLALAYGLKQEKLAGLTLRQFGGPAIGYQFLEGKPTSLLTELGISYFNEDYVDQADNDFLGPAWKLEFERELVRSKLRFYHNHLTTISAEDTGKYLWQSWTGLSVPLIGGLVGSGELELDHDSEPALRAEETDTTFRLKIGYEW